MIRFFERSNYLLFYKRAVRRSLSSNSRGANGTTIRGPSPFSTSWGRSAKLVKNTDTTNQYLEHIRDIHDPSQHIKTLEDEIRGTMGQALGKQGEKILSALRSMEKERERYEQLMASAPNSVKEIRECVTRHNQFRKNAKTARWELLVHRQAVGFIVNNHKVVHEKFPIGEELVVPDHIDRQNEQGSTSMSKAGYAEKQKKAKFGDQLDWWERIGRWR